MNGEQSRSLGKYVAAYAALLLVISVNFGLSFVDMGEAGMPVAVSLATLTVLILGLYFMHLLEHSAVARLVILVGVAFVALLGGLMVLDVVARTPQVPTPYFNEDLLELSPRRVD